MPVHPTQDQIAAISALAGSPDDGPLVMLNLNKYRDQAVYEGEVPNGLSPDCTGKEAYDRYAEHAFARLLEVGGSILWYTKATLTVIGDETDVYDEVIAVRYPSAQAFVDLALDPELMIQMAHRTAGLERSGLIRCDEGELEPSVG